MTELLRHRYRYQLDEFENSFTEEQLTLSLGPLENCRRDMESCQKCNGSSCRTIVSRKDGHYYYALQPEATASYGYLIFAIYKCPGVLVRKEEIFAIYRRVNSQGNSKVIQMPPR